MVTAMSWDDIKGWTDEHLLRIYDAAVAAAQPGDTLVEVGVAYGRSLAYLAQMAILAEKAVRILGVDVWEGNTPDAGPNNLFIMQAECISEMQRHAPHAYERVTLIKGPSTDVATSIVSGRPSFVFIDASHAYPDVLADIAAWTPRLREGGVIAGHDHSPSYPGVERAVSEYFEGDYDRVGSCWRKRL